MDCPARRLSLLRVKKGAARARPVRLLLRWFRSIRGRSLILPLLGFLLQVIQLLKLLGSKNGPDLRRSGLSHFIGLGDFLLLRHCCVVAQCIELLIFFREDWLQLGFLFIRQVQRIFVPCLRLPFGRV